MTLGKNGSFSYCSLSIFLLIIIYVLTSFNYKIMFYFGFDFPLQEHYEGSVIQCDCHILK